MTLAVGDSQNGRENTISFDAEYLVLWRGKGNRVHRKVSSAETSPIFGRTYSLLDLQSIIVKRISANCKILSLFFLLSGKVLCLIGSQEMWVFYSPPLFIFRSLPTTTFTSTGVLYNSTMTPIVNYVAA